MTFENAEYELRLASDIVNDGMHLELDVLSGTSRETVASVFYSDVDGSMCFTGYQKDVPLAAVEYLIQQAHRRLPPADAKRRE